jgi:hypothetical protein
MFRLIAGLCLLITAVGISGCGYDGLTLADGTYVEKNGGADILWPLPQIIKSSNSDLSSGYFLAWMLFIVLAMFSAMCFIEGEGWFTHLLGTLAVMFNIYFFYVLVQGIGLFQNPAS